MLKSLIVLQDGTEIYSGTGTENAIQSCKIKESVNSTKELFLGSVCSSVVEAKIFTPNGGLSINGGDEITVYKLPESGIRTLFGKFTVETPTRPSANTIKIIAYDRITWLDKDVSEWLAGLNGWPYTLYNFANMVCNACGLILETSSIPNGSYQVQKFSAKGITGRKLMQWIGEAAGRFCRATPGGNIEFAWYEPSNVSISPSGDNFYYQNGLTYEDYEVAPIEKVQIKLTQDDVGVIWPNDTEEKNTYIISGNYLLTTVAQAALEPVAQTLYDILKDVTYTPCKVNVPSGQQVRAGNIVQITDRNGKSFSTYVMTRTISGHKEILESTGSHKRNSTTAVNNQSFEALSGKLLEIKQSIDGFSITATEIKGSAIYSTVDEFYLSTSPSYLYGGSWSSVRPGWVDGMYVWLRAKVTKGDGTVSYTPSEEGVCISGNTGASGTDGADAIVCRIDSSGGFALKDNATVTLTARIFVGAEEIDAGGEMDYTWYRSIDGSAYESFASGKAVLVREDSYNNFADIYFTTEGGAGVFDDITVVNGVMTIYALANDPAQSGEVLNIT